MTFASFSSVFRVVPSCSSLLRAVSNGDTERTTTARSISQRANGSPQCPVGSIATTKSAPSSVAIDASQ